MKRWTPIVFTIGILVGLVIGTAIGIRLENKGGMIDKLDNQISKVHFDYAMEVFLLNPKTDKAMQYEWALDVMVRYLLREKLYEEYQFEKYRQQSK